MALTIDRGQPEAEATMYKPNHRIYLNAEGEPCLEEPGASLKLLCIPGREIAQDIADDLGLAEFEAALEDLEALPVEEVEPEPEAEAEPELEVDVADAEPAGNEPSAEDPASQEPESEASETEKGPKRSAREQAKAEKAARAASEKA